MNMMKTQLELLKFHFVWAERMVTSEIHTDNLKGVISSNISPAGANKNRTELRVVPEHSLCAREQEKLLYA